ncbi:MAG TPA: heme o synthase [Candidatus Binatia bacterium]|nr:heme o synthase [Candidatus Binatia bacterium]
MFRIFALLAAVGALVLAVLGSWVRINGAGLTCPDWPLCQGALIPALGGGVILEWSHRMVALLESLLVAATLALAWRERARIALIRPAVGFVAGLFLVQVLLGAATVRLANAPLSVALHWGTAMLFLAGLVGIVVLALLRPAPGSLTANGDPTIGLTAACTLAAFATMCVGAYVSSSGGLLLPWHRAVAAILIVCASAALVAVRRHPSTRVKLAVATGFAFVVTQALLGLANIALHLPTPLREAHAANAGATFVAFMVALVLSVIDARSLERRGLFARVEGLVPVRVAGWRGLLDDYYELTKPRIIFLLLITTIAAMLMAARGLPPLQLVFWTLLGGALAAGSGGAFNCIIDRDIDRLMRRTMDRPLAARRISVPNALIYASTLGIASFAMLYVFVNPLAAWLSLTGNLYYVVVYSLWLKRITPLNIVIGGAAGAVPPLVGWAAVTGHLGSPAFALFAVIFLWTPPHFWALALMTNTDYDKAGIPMLPNVKGVAHTKREIVIYSIVLVGVSLAFFPMHVLGPCYGGCALILGGIFLWDAWKMTGDPTKRYARALFRFSLLYLALMCVAMVADRIIL